MKIGAIPTENAKGQIRRGAAALLAAALIAVPTTLGGCSSDPLADYPESIQLMYQDYEANAMTEDELIDGFDACLNNGEITQEQYDALCAMVEQDDAQE